MRINACDNPKCRKKFGLYFCNPMGRSEKYCSKRCLQEGEEERIKQRNERWLQWLDLVH